MPATGLNLLRLALPGQGAIAKFTAFGHGPGAEGGSHSPAGDIFDGKMPASRVAVENAFNLARSDETGSRLGAL